MGCEWMDYKMTVVTADGLRDAIDFMPIPAATARCIVARIGLPWLHFLREGRRRLCLRQRVYGLYRRRPVWLPGQNRHIYPEAARTRPMGLPEITTYNYLVIRRRPDSVK